MFEIWMYRIQFFGVIKQSLAYLINYHIVDVCVRHERHQRLGDSEVLLLAPITAGGDDPRCAWLGHWRVSTNTVGVERSGRVKNNAWVAVTGRRGASV